MDKDQPLGGEPVVVAIDLGGTWVRVALVTRTGEIIWRQRVLTKSSDPRDAIIGRFNDIVSVGLSMAERRVVAGIGIATASPVDPVTGILYAPPNLLHLDGVSFKSIWQEKGTWPVLTGNDANLAALGEYIYGAGVGSRTLVYITQSTGIGGGIVVDGRLLDGAYGMAGEIGHMCIDASGPLCKCGHRGCLESYASGTAIRESAQKMVQTHSDSMLLNIVSGDLGKITAEVVFQAAKAGDEMCVELLEHVSKAFGVGLVNILHLLNPDTIVIGGGVSQNWDYLKPMVEGYVRANTMAHIRQCGFNVVVTSLGDDVGLLGAAALVWSSVDA